VLPVLSLAHPASVRSAPTRVAAIGLDPTAIRRFAVRASRSETRPQLDAVTDVVSTTVATTAAPTTTKPARQVLAATTTATRRATTTTRPPAPPTTQPPPPTTRPPGNIQYGLASWLDIIPAGTCANNIAPMGAVLTVTDTDTGAAVMCQVVSRGPYGSGRVVDLAVETFAQLVPPSQGLINVRVTW
jgi:hypothetical protein